MIGIVVVLCETSRRAGGGAGGPRPKSRPYSAIHVCMSNALFIHSKLLFFILFSKIFTACRKFVVFVSFFYFPFYVLSTFKLICSMLFFIRPSVESNLMLNTERYRCIKSILVLSDPSTVLSTCDDTICGNAALYIYFCFWSVCVWTNDSAWSKLVYVFLRLKPKKIEKEMKFGICKAESDMRGDLGFGPGNWHCKSSVENFYL